MTHYVTTIIAAYEELHTCEESYAQKLYWLVITVLIKLCIINTVHIAFHWTEKISTCVLFNYYIFYLCPSNRFDYEVPTHFIEVFSTYLDFGKYCTTFLIQIKSIKRLRRQTVLFQSVMQIKHTILIIWKFAVKLRNCEKKMHGLPVSPQHP